MKSVRRRQAKTSMTCNHTKISYEANNISELHKTPVSPLSEGRTSDDLINLRGSCTEASIINELKDRFSENLFQVF